MEYQRLIRNLSLLALCIITASAYFSSRAYAECTLAPTTVCNGAACGGETRPTGHLQFNADLDVTQVCRADGQWQVVIGGGGSSGGGGCTAPASCTSVGDVCSDGSIFAGFMVYNNSSCEPLYVTDNNQSTSSQWKNATGTNDISTDDHVDGQVNHANRGGAISNFPAFDLCESNTYHGKSDWYLPARAELSLLWLNRAAIDANAAGSFTTSDYWSSTEFNTGNVIANYFTTGGQYVNGKTGSFDVRCVRRD